MNKAEQIIKIYETEFQHPSLGYIRKKVGCSKTYVFLVLKKFKKDKKKG